MLLKDKYKGFLQRAYSGQFFRFIMVSIVNTVFGFLFFSFLIFLKFHYSVAILFSTILGVLFNFQTTGKFVFYNKNNKLIFRFMAVYMITYVLFTIGTGLLINFQLNSYIAGAILIFPIGVISFILNKKIVFI